MLSKEIFDGRPYYFEESIPSVVLCDYGYHSTESNFFMDSRKKKYIKEQVELAFIIDSGFEYRQLHERAMVSIFAFMKENDVFKSACKVLCYRFDKKYGYVAIEVYVSKGKE